MASQQKQVNLCVGTHWCDWVHCHWFLQQQRPKYTTQLVMESVMEWIHSLWYTLWSSIVEQECQSITLFSLRFQFIWKLNIFYLPTCVFTNSTQIQRRCRLTWQGSWMGRTPACSCRTCGSCCCQHRTRSVGYQDSSLSRKRKRSKREW